MGLNSLHLVLWSQVVLPTALALVFITPQPSRLLSHVPELCVES